MGENFWPYSIEENRKSLETLTRYVHEQGLTSQQFPLTNCLPLAPEAG